MNGIVSLIAAGLGCLSLALPSNAFAPDNYSYSSTMPSRVYFTDGLSSLAGYEYDVSLDYTIDYDETFNPYYGYAYVPLFADVSYSDSGYTLDYVQCVSISSPDRSVLDDVCPYYFMISTAGTSWYMMEKSYCVCQAIDDVLFNTAYTSHTTYYSSNGGYVRTSTYFINSSSSSLGSYAYMDGTVFLEAFEPFVWSFIASAGKSYNTSLGNAYQAGYDEGKQVGFDLGYDAGLDAVYDDVNTMNTLFSVMMEFPFTILNGFNAFVVWDTPVMTILVSFFVMGLVLWVVKRFI